jgi:hypothetical protein
LVCTAEVKDAELPVIGVAMKVIECVIAHGVFGLEVTCLAFVREKCVATPNDLKLSDDSCVARLLPKQET